MLLLQNVKLKMSHYSNRTFCILSSPVIVWLLPRYLPLIVQLYRAIIQLSSSYDSVIIWLSPVTIRQVIVQLSSDYCPVSISLYCKPKHWFWEYLVGNNNMRRRRMGEMQTKFHQKTYICLLSLVFNRWQSDFFSIWDARHLYFFAFISPKIQLVTEYYICSKLIHQTVTVT